MARYARSWQPLLMLVVTVALLALPQLSLTQVTVTGRVVVGETGRSLEGATVILERRNGEGGEVERAQTSDKGRFEWEGVAAGEYTVRIEAEGYLERTREVTVAGEDVHLALSAIATPRRRLASGPACHERPEPMAKADSGSASTGSAGGR
jgi:5-hydroxyisourate hydrolase-like protein (transthyretin family)